VILEIPNPEIFHISGVQMGDIDSSSRFKEHNLHRELLINLSQNKMLNELFILFDFTSNHSLDTH
jgi:hypothetical protein